MRRLGLIGGTGLLSFPSKIGVEFGRWEFEESTELRIDTEWGEVPITAAIFSADKERREVFFLQRHHRDSSGSKIPHAIEHRANVAAIAACDVEAVLAICSVGGVAPHFEPGMVALASQYVDSSGSPTSFHRDEAVFTSMSTPFDLHLNSDLMPVLRESQPEHAALRDDEFLLTYWFRPGPQYETAAEIAMIMELGGDCVGMTLAAEAKLMAEKEQRFAALLICSNHAAGTDPEDPAAELNHQRISASANDRLGPVWACIVHLLG